MADNELSRLADPDEAALAALLDEARAGDAGLLAAIGYDEGEFQELLARVGGDVQGDGDAEPQIDRAAELQAKWGTELGQVWAIGEHRLAIGDCTDPAVVAAVMQGGRGGAVVADPPYGINREGIENDDPEGLRALFDGCLATMPIVNAVVIAFQSPRLFPVWMDVIRARIS